MTPPNMTHDPTKPTCMGCGKPCHRIGGHLANGCGCITGRLDLCGGDPTKSAAADAAANAAAYSARHTYALGWEAGQRAAPIDRATTSLCEVLQQERDDARAMLAHIRTEGAKALEEATAALQYNIDEAQRLRDALTAAESRIAVEVAGREVAEKRVCELAGIVGEVRTQYEDDTPVARAIDAALDSTADIAGRWRLASEVVGEEYETHNAYEENMRRVMTERDAAIARADEASDFWKSRDTRSQLAIADAERARDEVGIQLAAAQAVIARMRGTIERMRELRADGIMPDRVARAMDAILLALDTVPGDALAPKVDGVIRVGDHVGYMGAAAGHHCGYVETLNDTEAGRIDFKPLCRVRRDRYHEGMGPFFWSTADSLTHVPPTSPAGASGPASGSTPAASSATSSVSEVEGSRCGQSGTTQGEFIAACNRLTASLDAVGNKRAGDAVMAVRDSLLAHLEALGIDTSNVKGGE